MSFYAVWLIIRNETFYWKFFFLNVDNKEEVEDIFLR